MAWIFRTMANFYDMDHSQEQSEQNDVDPLLDPKLTPSLERTLPQTILVLLQRQRAENAEQRRIAREKEKEQKIQDVEADLKDMVSEIVKAASSTKKRKCMLQFFQTTTLSDVTDV